MTNQGASDLWVITCYFNPCRYRARRDNFDRFMAGLKAVGAKVLTAELAFGHADFELPESENVLRLRSDSILWHKERLFNLAAATLPRECRKIAWLDNDILFDDPRWLERTSTALDRHMVVQPYSSCSWLSLGEREYPASGETFESFAHCAVRSLTVARTGNYLQHGHTGFAWAARRELFETCGLYDAAMTGSGDHLMAHAFAGGMIHTPCLEPMTGEKTAYAKHFWRWAVKARDLVKANIGFVPGTVLHLWHGPKTNRPYGKLEKRFKAFNYDPDRHLADDDNGLLRWSDEAPQDLRDWIGSNFERRREDDNPDEEPIAVNA
jgi:hypothetical protein